MSARNFLRRDSSARSRKLKSISAHWRWRAWRWRFPVYTNGSLRYSAQVIIIIRFSLPSNLHECIGIMIRVVAIHRFKEVAILTAAWHFDWPPLSSHAISILWHVAFICRYMIMRYWKKATFLWRKIWRWLKKGLTKWWKTKPYYRLVNPIIRNLHTESRYMHVIPS